jgi:hypothetical protein
MNVFPILMNSRTVKKTAQVNEQKYRYIGISNIGPDKKLPLTRLF